jgi:hypothetical protein
VTRTVQPVDRRTVLHVVVVLAVLAAGIVSAATMRASSPVGPDTLRLVGSSGSAVAATGSYRMDMDFAVKGSGMDVQVDGWAHVSTSGYATGELDMPDGTVLRFLASEERGWYGLPAGSPLRADGTRWVGFPAPSGTAAPVEDPLAFLSAMTADGEIRDHGAEQVGGVATRHYQGALDFDALVEEVSRQQGSGLMTGQLAGVDVDAVMHLWLADDGLPRRIRVELDVEGMDFRVQFELSEFGAPVEVSPPPPDEVLGVASQEEAMVYVTGS